MDRRLYAEAARARKAVKLVVAARRRGLTGLDLVSHPLVQADLVRETGVHEPSGVTWALAATLLDELPGFVPESTRGWERHIGRTVVRKNGAGTVGEVRKVTDRFVFVCFWGDTWEACDPGLLQLEPPEPDPPDTPYVPSADDLAAMRDWCADALSDYYPEDASDADVLSAVALNYDGGLDGWHRDGLSVYP